MNDFPIIDIADAAGIDPIEAGDLLSYIRLRTNLAAQPSGTNEFTILAGHLDKLELEHEPVRRMARAVELCGRYGTIAVTLMHVRHAMRMTQRTHPLPMRVISAFNPTRT